MTDGHAALRRSDRPTEREAIEVITPDWPAPSSVRAFTTTRNGGVSSGPYASLNLGTHVGDDQASVEENRRRLRSHLGYTTEPIWLEQTHGTEIGNASNKSSGEIICADASMTLERRVVCVVMTADCLPILITDRGGRCAAAVHGRLARTRRRHH